MAGQKLARLCVLWSVFSVTECVWRSGWRRRRSEMCPDGMYVTQNGLRCCLCPKGHYVETDCSSLWGTPVCSDCEAETYMDHVNSEKKCEPCKTCSSNENMEVETQCSASSNTVCRCQELHYCDKGDDCKVCYSCNTCEGFGVKAPCTLTNDTQCNEEAQPVQSAGYIVFIVFIVLLSLAPLILLLLFLRKKKMFCFHSPETAERVELSLQLLNDPDLGRFLPQIAEILGFKVVRNVVRRQGLLTQSTVDNIMDEHPHDANERAHQLLLAWYEKHGQRGAYSTLTTNLLAINMRVEAEKVHKLIQDGSSNGQTAQNGDD